MNYKNEIETIVKFIEYTFNKKGFKNAIIGVSGGIDSAVVVALCDRALGKENVYGYALPCGEQKDINDSRKIAGLFDINYEEINIAPIVSKLIETMPKYFGTLPQGRIGNFASRTRANILYDKSAEYGLGLVVGTSNKTELMLGYFTLGGDGLCALEPIGHLYKTEVFEIAKELGIPQSIIDKAPTAGLWEGQTDEGEIGLSYNQIDECLRELQKGIKFTDTKYNKIYSMIVKNKFKLEPIPMLDRI